MELFMDNLRNVVLGKKSKHASRVDTAALARGAAMGALAFLVGRGMLSCGMGVCGAALITALLAAGRGWIYALPVMACGVLTAVSPGTLGTAVWTSYEVWADLGAALLCGVLFFAVDRRRLGRPLRWLLAAAVVAATELSVALTTHTLFLHDLERLGGDLLLLLVWLYLFETFFLMLEKGVLEGRSPGEAVLVLTAVTVLAAAGVWPGALWGLSPLHMCGLFLALLAGYWLGPLEGALAGLAAGLVMAVVTGDSPAVAGILGSGGAAAGCFREQNRAQAGICFAAVCLLFGLAKGDASLYLPVWEPLGAAVLFALLPPAVWRRGERLAGKIAGRAAPGDLTARERMKNVLSAYQKVFSDLSLLYNRPGEERSRRQGDPARDALACQCKGMARATERLMEDLTEAPPLLRRQPRYNIQTGISTYAREKGASGDSYLCTEFREGQYLAAISDGMGKGPLAQQESATALRTLHNLMKAGFDVELSLRVLNSVLLVKGEEESYSTVDLGLFNRYTGLLRLFKIGASSSYIKRGDTVKALRRPALPVGIIDRIPVEDIQIRLKSGDKLILVSDGITEADREDGEALWLEAALSEIRSKDPQTVADLILNRAMERWGLRERDDMTVVVAQVQ
ncbi:MAG: SpoIIE family protein phosphatase [Bacillota bacterium]|nr:SpoIIE family protein phosphatase [Bacillota bacterium]